VRLRELVAPGGLLVLTVPFAEHATVDDFQRVYDEAGLRELLAGWDVRTSLRVGRTDRLTWQLGEPSRERHGVALVTAVSPPAAAPHPRPLEAGQCGAATDGEQHAIPTLDSCGDAQSAVR
jgi:hypothetical protein